MNNKKFTHLGIRPGKKAVLMVTVIGLSFGCHKSNVHDKDLKDFTQVNLVANKEEEYHPKLVDPTLINGFGVAWSPTGIPWVNSVGGHVSELYKENGDNITRLRGINIPGSATDTATGFPCGIVFSGNKNFALPNGNSVFLFTGFDGVLSGWNGASGNNAQFLRKPANASYTGLAIGASGGQNYIYGANFGAERIDVWDSAFRPVRMPFKDPYLPDGYSPYNIQAVGDWLFVVYAKLEKRDVPGKGHGVEGPGNGFVSVFNTDGSFIKRFASRGSLDIPWGITMAAGSFLEDNDMGDDNGGGHGGYETQSNSSIVSNGRHDPKDPVILVGNFGNGRINVFTQEGKYLGQLQSHKHTIVIDGLWALTFPPTTSGLDPKRLYFSAGPDSERDGLFGYLIKQ
ncbi:TIGR03118 family protein [Flavitalea flava]